MLAPSEVRALLRWGTPQEVADATNRSYLGDGRVVGWFGAAGVVVDAELHAVIPPRALAARYGSQDFWERWTAAECRAKLANVPIVLWLRRHGLDGDLDGVDVLTCRYRTDGITVSVARSASHDRGVSG